MKIVIRFRLRTKTNASNASPLFIYCRIRVNGVAARSDMATGVSCLRSEWDNKAQRIRGNSEGIRQQNAKLDKMRSDIDSLYNEFRKYDKPFTAEVIKQSYTKKQDITPRTLLVYYQKYLDEHQAAYVEVSTMRTWKSRLKAVRDYLNKKLKRKDIDLVEVTPQWLQEYQRHHTQTMGNGLNHAARAVGAIKTVMDWVVLGNVLQYNSTRSYKPPRDKPKPIKFLSQLQLEKLATCPYYDDRLTRVVDCFLVQAYTGMAYNELLQFDKKQHLMIDRKGINWIMINRGKTTELSTIPLLASARILMEKYDYKLPVVSNQKMNDYIKEAAILAGLDNVSEISTHIARKTAGMFLLNAGLRIESVSKILGHRSVKITERYYATLLTDSLADDLRKNGLI